MVLCTFVLELYRMFVKIWVLKILFRLMNLYVMGKGFEMEEDNWELFFR